MKYYRTSNSTIPIAGVQFERYSIIGGSSFGVHATADKDLIAKLDALVNDGKLSTLTEPEYARCLKKKPREFSGFFASNPPESKPASPVVKVAVEPTAESTPEPVVVTPVDAAADVVQVAPVIQPTEAATVAEPVIPQVPETPKKRR